jgi:hypothetical protein
MADVITMTMSCPGTITWADVLAFNARPDEVGGKCDGEVEIVGVPEGGEWYGADADGNRGMWIEQYLALGAEPSDLKCCPCGHRPRTPEEVKVWETKAEARLADYDNDLRDARAESMRGLSEEEREWL